MTTSKSSYSPSLSLDDFNKSSYSPSLSLDDFNKPSYSPSLSLDDFNKLSPQASSQTPFALQVPDVDTTSSVSELAKQKAPQAALLSLEQIAAEEKFSIKKLQSDPQLFKDISNYMTARFNEPQGKNESNEEYVNRFLGKMRFNDFNTVGSVNELNWIRNADKNGAIVAAKAHDIYERTASFYESGGGSTLDAAADIGKAIFLDPVTYLGVGVGSVAKTMAAREAMQVGVKSILNSKLARVGFGATVEGLAGAGQSVVSQRIGQETDIAMEREVRDISPLAVGLSAAFAGFFGGAGATGVEMRKSGKEKLQEIITSKSNKAPSSPTAPLNRVQTIVADELTNNMDNLVSQFMKTEGKDILEGIDPAMGLTDSKIQKDVSAAAVRVAAKIIVDDPTFQLKEGQKISDAIANVFKNLDQVNDVALERAIRSAGLTPDEFAKANLTTVSEAASIMQQYSAVSKMFERLGKIDPEFEKRAAELFGKQEASTSALGKVGQFISKAERESKAWVVSGLGTTMRNILGTTGGLIFRSFASLFESTIFAFGRTLETATTGKTTNLFRGTGSTIKDAFNELGYLYNAGLSAEVTDVLLKHNPSIRNNLLSALQESEAKDVSRAARFFNSLNVAQDAFFRRAIFTASVEKKLSQMGVDMYQLIAENKAIPSDVLSSAVDDALKATFSYMPKPARKDVSTFEARAETMAHHFVKFFEDLPGGSLLVTFPRFMSNAMAFQYRYSVFGAASGMQDMLKGAIKNSEADFFRGAQNFSRGVVGTAALYAAYYYRKQNADSEWYNYTTDSGMTVDLRPVFPIGPYLAVGEFIARMQSGDPIKAAEMIEAIVGMKIPAGTQNTLLDQIVSSVSSEKDADKWNIAIGKVLGDFTSRFTAPWPFKTATEFYALFDREEALARDPNVISSDDKLMEAAVNRVKKNVVGLKQDLPETVKRLRTETPVKDAAFFRSLFGLSADAPPNFAEKEVARLNIDPYKLFGSSSGDKEYDRTFIEISNPHVLDTMKRVMNDPRYQELPTRTHQRVAMMNSVHSILTSTRERTNAKFASEDLANLFRIQFNKMSADKRKIINEAYAKDHDGRTLEEDKAYKDVPKYEGKAVLPLQFAVGGIVKGITKAASKLLDLDVEKAVNTGIEAAVSATPDVLKQADEVLINPALAVKQTDELLQKEYATLKDVPEFPLDIEVVSKPSVQQPYKEVKGKKYYTEDVLQAEQQAKDFFKSSGMDDVGIEKAIKDDPDWFETQVREQLYEAGANLYKATQPSVAKTEAAGTTAIGKRAIATENIPVNSGDMNDIPNIYSLNTRSEAIINLRDIRDFSMTYLMDNPIIKGLKDSELVTAVLQGDWRAKTGVEIDPFNKNQMKEFTDMAKQYQKRLDDLREEYKDAPPKRLYHGSGEWKDPTTRYETGLEDPQKSGRAGQVELGLKAVSFTSDPAMNIARSGFGGKNPERYIYTEMPRAEYEFKRVNMTPKEYDERDMNAIVRTLTGSDNVIRPLSLPRSSYKETEDALIEVDKFKPGASKDVGEKLYSAREKQGALIGKNVELMRLENDTIGTINFLRERAKGATEKEQDRIAYALYGQVRDLLNIYLGQAGGPDTRGLGQNYLQNLERISGTYGPLGFAASADPTSNLMSQMPSKLDMKKLIGNLAKYFEEAGVKQKASNLKTLNAALDVISEETIKAQSSNVKKKIDAVNTVRDLTRQFKKGGLAAKK
jgi:hypothetical protein